MVRTQTLSKHFTDPKRGTIKAVEDVTFEAKPGQITGLLGKNGAGKSTLLRMLSTVIKPTHGKAEVAGIDVVEHPDKVRSAIGFMSTSTALYGRMSPKEILEYFGALYGLEGAKLNERVKSVMDRFDIHPYGNGMCDKLSTGQKQRVNIARTILHDPQVLFFDEPTSGLDVVLSQDVMEFVEEARTQGKTVIYCSHIMSEIERLCDTIVIVHDGTVRGIGSAEELKATTGEPSLEKAFLSTVGFKSALSSAGSVA